MKKLILFIAMILVLSLAAFACANEEETVVEKNQETVPSVNQFDAKILEIQEEYLMVEALEGQSIAGEVKVWIGSLEEGTLPVMEVGDVIRLTHDGKMTMSIPPQMSAVGEIEIILR